MIKKRVLIVDDNEAFVDLVRQEVEELGCHADVALNGEQALAKIQSQKQDVLVLDLILPDFDAVELLTRLPAGSTADARLILLTNLAETTERWRQASEQLKRLEAQRTDFRGLRIERKPLELLQMRALLQRLVNSDD